MRKFVTTDSSSCIKEITYDTETTVLKVTFYNGAYYYKAVPENIFNAFITAPSFGKFFNENIKNRYITSDKPFTETKQLELNFGVYCTTLLARQLATAQ